MLRRAAPNQPDYLFADVLPLLFLARSLARHHSFYLMDPTGQFVDAFGRSATQSEVVAKVDTYMKEWKAGVRRDDA